MQKGALNNCMGMKMDENNMIGSFKSTKHLLEI